MAREFTMPQRIISGQNSLETAKPYLKEMGKKAFIITGKHVVNLDCFKNLTESLEEINVEYTIFTGITGEPADTMINEGLEEFKNSNSDFLIAIGGGSPLDSMKAIATLYANGGKIPDYMGKIITGKMPKMVAIPTTAGTGSEVTQFTIITDSEKGVKMLLKGPCLIPSLAIVDPVFSLSSPKSITCATGLDALTHAIEAYASKKSQPMSDLVCVSAVKRIFEYLPIAYNDGTNIKAREEMAMAALEAGIAINNSSTTIVHGMSRPIGANFHVPHGISNAMLLSVCLGFAKDGAIEKFANLGRAIGLTANTDEEIADKFLLKMKELCDICEVPTLEEYGINKEDFFAKIDKMSDDAIASGSPATTAKEISKDDIVNMYKQLFL